jgi:selenide,water dikinase
MLGIPPYRQWAVESGVQVTLIARDLHTPYSGMLPGFIAGHYTYDEIHLDLVKLCRFSNTRLIYASAERIDYNSKHKYGGGWVYCSDGRPPVRFDAISMDIGITPSTSNITFSCPKSTLESIIPVKPIAKFCNYYGELQKQILAKCNKHEQDKNHKHVVAVVGGGAGGIELAMSMDFYFKEQGCGDHVQLVICTRGNSLLESHNKRVQNIFRRTLQERNIRVYFQAEVIDVQPTNENSHTRSRLILSKATEAVHKDQAIVVDDVLWCTQAAAASWLSEKTPFETTKEGNFIKVNSTYESVSHRGVFACGDCCHMVDNPRPKGTRGSAFVHFMLHCCFLFRQSSLTKIYITLQPECLRLGPVHHCWRISRITFPINLCTSMSRKKTFWD